MNIKELLITQPSIEQILSAYPSEKPQNCTIRDYDFAVMSMMQSEDNRDIAELKCLLTPCSFGQAMVMMEKGAVVFSDYYNKYCTISAESIGAFKVFVDFGEGASWYSLDTYVRDLIGSKFRYAPWFKDGVIDQEVKDFCDDILVVKNENLSR